MSIHVKDGTPMHSGSLCETCVFAHIERGYCQNEIIVYCRATYLNHLVMFPEVKRHTLKQMEEIAWVLMPRNGKRVVGFVKPSEVPED